MCNQSILVDPHFILLASPAVEEAILVLPFQNQNIDNLLGRYIFSRTLLRVRVVDLLLAVLGWLVVLASCVRTGQVLDSSPFLRASNSQVRHLNLISSSALPAWTLPVGREAMRCDARRLNHGTL